MRASLAEPLNADECFAACSAEFCVDCSAASLAQPVDQHVGPLHQLSNVHIHGNAFLFNLKANRSKILDNRRCFRRRLSWAEAVFAVPVSSIALNLTDSRIPTQPDSSPFAVKFKTETFGAPHPKGDSCSGAHSDAGKRKNM